MGRALLKWNEWHPGLDTDEMLLGEVMATMPAADQEDVPEIIRKYENPESPDALPGAISLIRHDNFHCLFGRGLMVTDEAWILGVQMGAASDMTEEAAQTFIRVATQEYPKHWRFSEEDIFAYRLGIGFAQEHLPNRDLHLIPVETSPWQEMTIGAIRRELGINKHELRAYFRKEELLIPGTRSSRRLDTCARRPDGDLTPEEAENRS